MIDTHDYEVKIKQAKKFLSQGNKVKFTMRFKGREISNDLGRNVLNNIVEDLEGLIKVDSEPKTRRTPNDDDGFSGLIFLTPTYFKEGTYRFPLYFLRF